MNTITPAEIQAVETAAIARAAGRVKERTMDKCELEAKNYQELLEYAAEWRNPPGILERLKRAAHDAARKGRGVEYIRSGTFAKIINGEPRGINAPTAAPTPEPLAPPCTSTRRPGHLRLIEGGRPSPAA